MSNTVKTSRDEHDRLPVPAAWQPAAQASIQALCERLGVPARHVAVTRVDEVAGTGVLDVWLVSGGRSWKYRVEHGGEAPTLVG